MAQPDILAVWARRDSNPHALRHMLLRHARLPFRHSPVAMMIPQLSTLRNASCRAAQGVVQYGRSPAGQPKPGDRVAWSEA